MIFFATSSPYWWPVMLLEAVWSGFRLINNNNKRLPFRLADRTSLVVMGRAVMGSVRPKYLYKNQISGQSSWYLNVIETLLINSLIWPLPVILREEDLYLWVSWSIRCLSSKICHLWGWKVSFKKAKSINTTDLHCLGWQQQQLLLQCVDANKNYSWNIWGWTIITK
jgi:hypothetical protein